MEQFQSEESGPTHHTNLRERIDQMKSEQLDGDVFTIDQLRNLILQAEQVSLGQHVPAEMYLKLFGLFLMNAQQTCVGGNNVSLHIGHIETIASIMLPEQVSSIGEIIPINVDHAEIAVQTLDLAHTA